ncbi:MAG: hypothetical protein GY730_06345 [bacterium]|nr:hypothetical protein [bacterium]
MDITISKHDIFLKDILNKSTEYIDYPCTVDRLMISIDNIKDISVSSGDKADIISLLRQQYLMRNEINNGSEKQYDFSEKYQLLTGLAVIRKFLIKKREKHSVCDKNIIINTLIKLITELKITAAANSNLKKNNRLINQLIKILNQMIDYNKRELRLSRAC